MQEQGDDEHADNGRNADHERAEGLGLVAILRGHFAEVGDDPEVGVVGVGHRHGAAPMADNRQASRAGESSPRTGSRGATIPAVVVMATVEEPCADFRIAASRNGKKMPTLSKTSALALM